jgi:8-oxo-dGTP pyrophosphatase MutT (NUDIX family)
MTPPPSTRDQTSAGGVVYREHDGRTEVALILVGEKRRWQLPKGQLDQGETPEQAAAREVLEETGLVADLESPLDVIEYWFWVTDRGERTRIHKRVHFYLFRATGGDVRDHDHEVIEARWVPIGEAIGMLAFKSERELVERIRV